jgi:hypothetical protein
MTVAYIKDMNNDKGPKQLWYSQKHYEEYDTVLKGRLVTGEYILYSFTFEDMHPNQRRLWPDLVCLGQGFSLT